MRKFYSLIVLLVMAMSVNAQSLQDLKDQKAAIDSQIKEKTGMIDELKGEADKLQAEIEKLSGWMTGISGNVGFNFSNAKNWVQNPNPTAKASGLQLGLKGYANNIKEKTLWRNSFLVSEEWLDVDLSDEENDGLLDNGTIDILNAASLYGYRIHPKLAITALGELNTSVGNFFKPGTIDLGAGITWTPNNNLVVILHPLNYHWAFSGFDGVSTTAALGAKLRAEYNNKFNIAGRTIGFSSILTSFLPYNDKKTVVGTAPNTWEAGLFEYTWMNSATFILWNGIGVNAGLGFRNAGFESEDLQTIYNIGLGYKF